MSGRLNSTMLLSLLLFGLNIGVLAIEHVGQESTALSRVGCSREAKCEQHSNLTCFGTLLPYSSTTIELVDDAENQSEVEDRLKYWEAGLKQIPRCWPVIQPLLCSLYRPPCRNNSVHLISSKLCEHARKACSIIMPLGGIEWPHFLRCEQDIFSKSCKSEMRKSETPKIRFNITPTCPSPLIATIHRESWYSEIEGCGVSCQQNPLITSEKQIEKSRYDAYIILFSATCCLLVLIMYAVNWPSSSSNYPNRMRIYLSICLLIVCAGYGAQFIVGRDAILCKRDGTIRRNEPSAEENLVCVANFIACYYFLNAAYAWFILVCYALHTSILVLPSQGLSEGDYWRSKSTYFHLIAWSAPLVLTIFVVALSDVEADSITGICTVSRDSIISQILLVVLPFIGTLLSGGWFLVHLMCRLDRRKSSGDTLNEQCQAYVLKAIIRLRLILLGLTVIGVMVGLCVLYDFRHLDAWRISVREHFSCRLNPGHHSPDDHLNEGIDSRSCDLKNKPSLLMLHMRMVIFAFACLILLIVTLNSSVAEAWKQACKKYILRKKTQSTKPPFTQEIAKLFIQTKKDEADDNEVDHGAGDSVSQSLSASYANMFPGMGYGVVPPIMVSRRYSSTSDVSRQTSKWMQSMARKRKTRKERDRHRVTEKTTSTGDLSCATIPLLNQHPQHQEQATLSQNLQIRKSMTNKKDLINPPFTHGLSAEARDNRLCPFRLKTQSPLISKEQPAPTAIPFAGIPVPPQQSLYATLPAAGHNGLHMSLPYAPQVYPLIDPFTGFPLTPYSPFFPPYGIMPQPANNFVPFPDLDNIKSPLIPLRAQETGSEASFRMIVLSDTEYDTDAYRPQTAVLRTAKQPRSGRLSAPFKKANGFFSS